MDYKEKVIALLKSQELSKEQKEKLENIFPELKESEEERIRKGLIKTVSRTLEGNKLFGTDVTREEALAWLGKQCEHANFRNKIQVGDKVTRNRDGVLVNLSQLKRVAKPSEKQGEQKPVVIIPKFRIGDNIKTTNEEPLTITKIDGKGYWSEDLFICGFDDAAKWELVEQKPAWSEEDEEELFNAVYACLNFYGKDSDTTDWLKSLKVRI